MNALTVVLVLLVSSFFALIGLIVLIKNHRDPANITFAGVALSLIIFILANFFSSFVVVPYNVAIIMNGLTALGGAVAVYFLYLFSLFFTNPQTRMASRGVVIMSLLAAVGIAMSPTPLVLQSMEAQGSLWVVTFGPLGIVFYLYIIGFFGAMLTVLIMAFQRSIGAARVRIGYVLLSLFISIGGAIVTNLAVPLFIHDFSLSPYGPFGTIFIIIGFSYAIVKHRLFDIRLIVARSVMYVLLLLTLAGLYIAAIFGITSLLFPNNDLTIVQKGVYVALAIILAFTFQPLRRFFERLTDRIFFRDKYDSQVVLNAIGTILSRELILDRVLKKTLGVLCQDVDIETGQIMVFDSGRIYKVAHYGPLPRKLMVAPTALKLRQSMLIADELTSGTRKAMMEQYGVRVSLMLRTHDEFVGFLFLGDKLSGGIYSQQDLRLLEILSQELAIAITNAKAYEDISEFNVTLQSRVNEATGRLRIANRDLKALDKTKDEFISMASHQLRTPLTTIKGYLSMALEGDAGRLSRAQREFIDFAYQGAERMVGLISDLLNVSRLSTGHFVLDTAPIDLQKVVSDEVSRLQWHATNRGLKLKLTLPRHKLPLIRLDEGKTRQVIMNFIDNALYYTAAGTVDVSLEADESKVYFRVKDTGIGVPETAQKKLFTKFFRAENAQAVRPDGTGLGLYLAKKVVEQQGGGMLFESVEGAGSTFGFSIGLKSRNATIKHRRAKPAQPKVIDVKVPVGATSV